MVKAHHFGYIVAMNKDYGRELLLSMGPEKQMKILYTLATYIEQGHYSVESQHFEKLAKYHRFLDESSDESIQKLNKEFHKVKQIDYQFEIYLMNLERLLGQSSKEYDFLVKTKDAKTPSDNPKIPIICLLDSIRSAHNVGAMLRNAECFNLEKVLICGLSAPGDHPQVVKTAMGAQDLVEWEYHQDPLAIVKKFKLAGYKVWAVETAREALNLNEIKTRPEKLILLLGHEHFGLSHELLKQSDKIISINLSGQKNSLNVSVAQGIVLNQLCALPKEPI